jgi:hypothetical protein
MDIGDRPRGSASSTVLVLLVVAFVAIGGWHVYAASIVRAEIAKRLSAERGAAEVRVHALTDVVTIRFPRPAELEREGGDLLGALGAAIGSMLGDALANAIEPAIERDLNTRARELFDLYAMLLPYRVKVIVEDPPETT